MRYRVTVPIKRTHTVYLCASSKNEAIEEAKAMVLDRVGTELNGFVIVCEGADAWDDMIAADAMKARTGTGVL